MDIEQTTSWLVQNKDEIRKSDDARGERFTTAAKGHASVEREATEAEAQEHDFSLRKERARDLLGMTFTAGLQAYAKAHLEAGKPVNACLLREYAFQFQRAEAGLNFDYGLPFEVLRDFRIKTRLLVSSAGE